MYQHYTEIVHLDIPIEQKHLRFCQFNAAALLLDMYAALYPEEVIPTVDQDLIDDMRDTATALLTDYGFNMLTTRLKLAGITPKRIVFYGSGGIDTKEDIHFREELRKADPTLTEFKRVLEGKTRNYDQTMLREVRRDYWYAVTDLSEVAREYYYEVFCDGDKLILGNKMISTLNPEPENN